MFTTEQIRELILNDQKKKFYHEKDWLKLSAEILERDNYECQECKKEGKLTIKQHKRKLDIHHIKELETNPELAYKKDNLETVCIYHHNILDNKQFNPSHKKKFINEERW